MKSKNSKDIKENLSFSRKSLLIFAAALVLIAVGYILMSAGNITLSPFFLVLGYVVMIPLAILKK